MNFKRVTHSKTVAIYQIFHQHLSDSKVFAEQHFIDAYYSALSMAGTPCSSKFVASICYSYISILTSIQREERGGKVGQRRCVDSSAFARPRQLSVRILQPGSRSH
jgi:hypothetical protein